MTEPIEKTQQSAWISALVTVARHYRLDCSEEALRVSIAWDKEALSDEQLLYVARQAGLELRFGEFNASLVDAWRLPAIIELSDGQIGVLQTADASGKASVYFSGDAGLPTLLAIQELAARVKRTALLRPCVSIPDARVDDYLKPHQKHWLWSVLARDWPRYGDIMMASFIANLLALGSMIFSMQIYDRVVPAQSEPTLWVLFGGVMLAIAFEFILRVARVRISDIIGKRADLKVSDLVFGHALRVRNDARPRSTGTFISQIRELEQVRELITSTTVGALADLPFFILFLVVLWLVAGPLALIPLLALPLLLIPGLLMQAPLARLSNEGMRESSLRNAILIESVQGIEDIKLLRAEARFQGQWNHANAVSAEISAKQRLYAGGLVAWTQEVQAIVYVLVLLVGCFMVMKGDMTTGVLVGASILASRMMAPLAQLSTVLGRWQQAKVARKSLDSLMALPLDQPPHGKLLHRPVIQGAYSLQQVRFQYSKEDKQPALEVQRLDIAPGERIALLGRNGAGKSTLLQLLAGMQTPQIGQVLLDGLSMPLIDPMDVRRDMTLVHQNSNLFFGTVRDNICMGVPNATDEDLLKVINLSGASSFVQSMRGGLDYMVMEGGRGLSGGQRQSILLARGLLRQPNIVLLDEPTAWLDDLTERHVIDQLSTWLNRRTLVVATHRMAVLRLVDRVVVIDGGRIVMDGPKDKVIAQLSARP